MRGTYVASGREPRWQRRLRVALFPWSRSEKFRTFTRLGYFEFFMLLVYCCNIIVLGMSDGASIRKYNDKAVTLKSLEMIFTFVYLSEIALTTLAFGISNILNPLRLLDTALVVCNLIILLMYYSGFDRVQSGFTLLSIRCCLRMLRPILMTTSFPAIRVFVAAITRSMFELGDVLLLLLLFILWFGVAGTYQLGGKLRMGCVNHFAEAGVEALGGGEESPFSIGSGFTTPTTSSTSGGASSAVNSKGEIAYSPNFFNTDGWGPNTRIDCTQLRPIPNATMTARYQQGTQGYRSGNGNAIAGSADSSYYYTNNTYISSPYYYRLASEYPLPDGIDQRVLRLSRAALCAPVATLPNNTVTQNVTSMIRLGDISAAVTSFAASFMFKYRLTKDHFVCASNYVSSGEFKRDLAHELLGAGRDDGQEEGENYTTATITRSESISILTENGTTDTPTPLPSLTTADPYSTTDAPADILVQWTPSFITGEQLFIIITTTFSVGDVSTHCAEDQPCSHDPTMLLRGYCCPYGYTCQPTRNPYAGFVGFDNLAQSLLVIFICLTWDIWHTVMFMARDGADVIAEFYFVILIVVGSFMVMNLTQVVLTVEYDRAKEEEDQKVAKLLQNSDSSLGASLGGANGGPNPNGGPNGTDWSNFVSVAKAAHARLKKKKGSDRNNKGSESHGLGTFGYTEEGDDDDEVGEEDGGRGDDSDDNSDPDEDAVAKGATAREFMRAVRMAVSMKKSRRMEEAKEVRKTKKLLKTIFLARKITAKQEKLKRERDQAKIDARQALERKLGKMGVGSPTKSDMTTVGSPTHLMSSSPAPASLSNNTSFSRNATSYNPPQGKNSGSATPVSASLMVTDRGSNQGDAKALSHRTFNTFTDEEMRGMKKLRKRDACEGDGAEKKKESDEEDEEEDEEDEEDDEEEEEYDEYGNPIPGRHSHNLSFAYDASKNNISFSTRKGLGPIHINEDMWADIETMTMHQFEYRIACLEFEQEVAYVAREGDTREATRKILLVKLRFYSHWLIVKARWWQTLMYLTALLNIVCLCTIHFEMPSYHTDLLEAMNVIFVGVLTVEIAVDALSKPIWEFLQSMKHVYMIFIAILGWLDVFVYWGMGASNPWLASCRSLRMIRLLYLFPDVYAWMRYIVVAIKASPILLFFVAQLLFIFSAFGTQAFGGIFCGLDDSLSSLPSQVEFNFVNRTWAYEPYFVVNGSAAGPPVANLPPPTTTAPMPTTIIPATTGVPVTSVGPSPAPDADAIAYRGVLLQQMATFSREYPTEQCEGLPMANFDTFGNALITGFQILSGDDWSNILFFAMERLNIGTAFAFIFYFYIGNYALLSLLVAILLAAGYHNEEEKSLELMLQEEKKRVADKKKADLEEEMRARGEDPASLLDEKGEGAGGEGDSEGSDFESVASSDRAEREMDVTRKASSKFVVLKSGKIRRKTLSGRILDTFFLNYDASRKVARSIVEHLVTQGFMICVIFTGTFAFAAISPADAPDTTVARTADIIDIVVMVISVIEVALQIHAYGFIRRHTAYLRRDWFNILDFILVGISVAGVVTSLTGLNSEYRALSVLRVFSSLRPIRMVKRSPGMRIVISAIFRAIPAIKAVVLCTLYIFVVWGIAGVLFFGGKLRQCMLSDGGGIANGGLIVPQLSKQECDAVGGIYGNPGPHFDNIGAALMALFQITTLEGWGVFMYNVMNARDYGEGMRRDANRTGAALYFIPMAAFAGFFLTNVFSATLIEAYNNEKRKAAFQQSVFVTREQTAWLTTNKRIARYLPLHSKQGRKGRSSLSAAAVGAVAAAGGVAGAADASTFVAPLLVADGVTNVGAVASSSNHPPSGAFSGAFGHNDSGDDESDDSENDTDDDRYDNSQKREEKKNKKAAAALMNQFHSTSGVVRNQVRRVIRSSAFENLVTLSVFLNFMSMAIEHYPQDSRVTNILDILNTVFIVLNCVEAAAKIAGDSHRVYFSAVWNRLDFFVAVVGLLVLILRDDVDQKAIALIRSFRVFRLILLTKGTVNVDKLLGKLGLAAAQLVYVFAIIILIFFVFSLVGMRLFATIRWKLFTTSDGIDSHSNFVNLHTSMMMMFRIITGANWNELMYSCGVQEPLCDPNIGECGSIPLAYAYYFVYVTLSFFVMRSLVVAVLLDSFATSAVNRCIRKVDAEKFYLTWRKYDPSESLKISPYDIIYLIRSFSPQCVLNVYDVKAKGRISKELAFLTSLQLRNVRKPVSMVKIIDALCARAYPIPPPAGFSFANELQNDLLTGGVKGIFQLSNQLKDLTQKVTTSAKSIGNSAVKGLMQTVVGGGIGEGNAVSSARLKDDVNNGTNEEVTVQDPDEIDTFMGSDFVDERARQCAALILINAVFAKRREKLRSVVMEARIERQVRARIEAQLGVSLDQLSAVVSAARGVGGSPAAAAVLSESLHRSQQQSATASQQPTLNATAGEGKSTSNTTTNASNLPLALLALKSVATMGGGGGGGGGGVASSSFASSSASAAAAAADQHRQQQQAYDFRYNLMGIEQRIEELLRPPRISGLAASAPVIGRSELRSMFIEVKSTLFAALLDHTVTESFFFSNSIFSNTTSASSASIRSGSPNTSAQQRHGGPVGAGQTRRLLGSSGSLALLKEPNTATTGGNATDNNVTVAALFALAVPIYPLPSSSVSSSLGVNTKKSNSSTTTPSSLLASVNARLNALTRGAERTVVAMLWISPLCSKQQLLRLVVGVGGGGAQQLKPSSFGINGNPPHHQWNTLSSSSSSPSRHPSCLLFMMEVPQTFSAFYPTRFYSKPMVLRHLEKRQRRRARRELRRQQQRGGDGEGEGQQHDYIPPPLMLQESLKKKALDEEGGRINTTTTTRTQFKYLYVSELPQKLLRRKQKQLQREEAEAAALEALVAEHNMPHFPIDSQIAESLEHLATSLMLLLSENENRERQRGGLKEAEEAEALLTNQLIALARGGDNNNIASSTVAVGDDGYDPSSETVKSPTTATDTNAVSAPPPSSRPTDAPSSNGGDASNNLPQHQWAFKLRFLRDLFAGASHILSANEAHYRATIEAVEEHNKKVAYLNNATTRALANAPHYMSVEEVILTKGPVLMLATAAAAEGRESTTRFSSGTAAEGSAPSFIFPPSSFNKSFTFVDVEILAALCQYLIIKMTTVAPAPLTTPTAAVANSSTSNAITVAASSPSPSSPPPIAVITALDPLQKAVNAHNKAVERRLALRDRVAITAADVSAELRQKAKTSVGPMRAYLSALFAGMQQGFALQAEGVIKWIVTPYQLSLETRRRAEYLRQLAKLKKKKQKEEMEAIDMDSTAIVSVSASSPLSVLKTTALNKANELVVPQDDDVEEDETQIDILTLPTLVSSIERVHILSRKMHALALHARLEEEAVEQKKKKADESAAPDNKGGKPRSTSFFNKQRGKSLPPIAASSSFNLSTPSPPPLSSVHLQQLGNNNNPNLLHNNLKGDDAGADSNSNKNTSIDDPISFLSEVEQALFEEDHRIGLSNLRIVQWYRARILHAFAEAVAEVHVFNSGFTNASETVSGGSANGGGGSSVASYLASTIESVPFLFLPPQSDPEVFAEEYSLDMYAEDVAGYLADYSLLVQPAPAAASATSSDNSSSPPQSSRRRGNSHTASGNSNNSRVPVHVAVQRIVDEVSNPPLAVLRQQQNPAVREREKKEEKARRKKTSKKNRSKDEKEGGGVDSDADEANHVDNDHNQQQKRPSFHPFTADTAETLEDRFLALVADRIRSTFVVRPAEMGLRSRIHEDDEGNNNPSSDDVGGAADGGGEGFSPVMAATSTTTADLLQQQQGLPIPTRWGTLAFDDKRACRNILSNLLENVFSVLIAFNNPYLDVRQLSGAQQLLLREQLVVLQKAGEMGNTTNKSSTAATDADSDTTGNKRNKKEKGSSAADTDFSLAATIAMNSLNGVGTGVGGARRSARNLLSCKESFKSSLLKSPLGIALMTSFKAWAKAHSSSTNATALLSANGKAIAAAVGSTLQGAVGSLNNSIGGGVVGGGVGGGGSGRRSRGASQASSRNGTPGRVRGGGEGGDGTSSFSSPMRSGRKGSTSPQRGGGAAAAASSIVMTDTSLKRGSNNNTNAPSSSSSSPQALTASDRRHMKTDVVATFMTSEASTRKCLHTLATFKSMLRVIMDAVTDRVGAALNVNIIAGQKLLYHHKAIRERQVACVETIAGSYLTYAWNTQRSEAVREMAEAFKVLEREKEYLWLQAVGRPSSAALPQQQQQQPRGKNNSAQTLPSSSSSTRTAVACGPYSSLPPPSSKQNAMMVMGPAPAPPATVLPSCVGLAAAVAASLHDVIFSLRRRAFIAKEGRRAERREALKRARAERRRHEADQYYDHDNNTTAMTDDALLLLRGDGGDDDDDGGEMMSVRRGDNAAYQHEDNADDDDDILLLLSDEDDEDKDDHKSNKEFFSTASCWPHYIGPRDYLYSSSDEEDTESEASSSSSGSPDGDEGEGEGSLALLSSAAVTPSPSFNLLRTHSAKERHVYDKQMRKAAEKKQLLKAERKMKRRAARDERRAKRRELRAQKKQQQQQHGANGVGVGVGGGGFSIDMNAALVMPQRGAESMPNDLGARHHYHHVVAEEDGASRQRRRQQRAGERRAKATLRFVRRIVGDDLLFPSASPPSPHHTPTGDNRLLNSHAADTVVIGDESGKKSKKKSRKKESQQPQQGSEGSVFGTVSAPLPPPPPQHPILTILRWVINTPFAINTDSSSSFAHGGGGGLFAHQQQQQSGEGQNRGGGGGEGGNANTAIVAAAAMLWKAHAGVGGANKNANNKNSTTEGGGGGGGDPQSSSSSSLLPPALANSGLNPFSMACATEYRRVLYACSPMLTSDAKEEEKEEVIANRVGTNRNNDSRNDNNHNGRVVELEEDEGKEDEDEETSSSRLSHDDGGEEGEHSAHHQSQHTNNKPQQQQLGGDTSSIYSPTSTSVFSRHLRAAGMAPPPATSNSTTTSQHHLNSNNTMSDGGDGVGGGGGGDAASPPRRGGGGRRTATLVGGDTPPTSPRGGGMGGNTGHKGDDDADRFGSLSAFSASSLLSRHHHRSHRSHNGDDDGNGPHQHQHHTTSNNMAASPPLPSSSHGYPLPRSPSPSSPSSSASALQQRGRSPSVESNEGGGRGGGKGYSSFLGGVGGGGRGGGEGAGGDVLAKALEEEEARRRKLMGGGRSASPDDMSLNVIPPTNRSAAAASPPPSSPSKKKRVAPALLSSLNNSFDDSALLHLNADKGRINTNTCKNVNMGMQTPPPPMNAMNSSSFSNTMANSRRRERSPPLSSFLTFGGGGANGNSDSEKREPSVESLELLQPPPLNASASNTAFWKQKHPSTPPPPSSTATPPLPLSTTNHHDMMTTNNTNNKSPAATAVVFGYLQSLCKHVLAAEEAMLRELGGGGGEDASSASRAQQQQMLLHFSTRLFGITASSLSSSSTLSASSAAITITCRHLPASTTTSQHLVNTSQTSLLSPTPPRAEALMYPSTVRINATLPEGVGAASPSPLPFSSSALAFSLEIGSKKRNNALPSSSLPLIDSSSSRDDGFVSFAIINNSSNHYHHDVIGSSAALPSSTPFDLPMLLLTSVARVTPTPSPNVTQSPAVAFYSRCVLLTGKRRAPPPSSSPSSLVERHFVCFNDANECSYFLRLVSTMLIMPPSPTASTPPPPPPTTILNRSPRGGASAMAGSPLGQLRGVGVGGKGGGGVASQHLATATGGWREPSL